MNLPKAGEVWFVDLGMVGKPRWCLVLGCATDGRLAVATVVLITTHFDGTPYEVALPRVPWLRAQSHANAQSLQPVKFSEFVRKSPGQFDARIVSEVKAAVKLWLKL
jgi:mRNA-degrading endonuclease toxin of MazEF toxin-antitoxin module